MEGLATQLIETYLHLEELCTTLKTHLLNLDENYGAMTLGLNDQLWRSSTQHNTSTSSNQYHRILASEIFSCLDHRHDGDGRDTWQMAGALVVPKIITTQALNINEVKNRFATLIHAYRQQQTATKPTLDRLFQPERIEYYAGSGAATRFLLKRQGRMRVHLRHATRHILCLKQYPKYMSLSWVRQRRSIQKVTFEHCMKKLDKLNRDSEDNHITIQIQALQQIPKHQHHLLRIVQTVAYPSIKTKVYWHDGSDNHLGYLSMPALIPAGTHKQLPPMTNIAPTPPLPRATRRRDNTLPEEALCPSIRLYLARDPATQDIAGPA